MERSPAMEGRALSVILTPGIKKAVPGAKAKDESVGPAEGAGVPVGGPPSEDGSATAEAPQAE